MRAASVCAGSFASNSTVRPGCNVANIRDGLPSLTTLVLPCMESELSKGKYFQRASRQKFTNTKVGVIKTNFSTTPNFLLTNYSFGKSFRTSTLCMTQVIFPTIVYRRIISLIIHCITIPVGQKFTYTKLTVPLNSLENSRK